MRDGEVVLHHITGGTQAGELDSVRVGEGGAFSFALPNVPDPARSDIFFVSVRHDGVLYFGPAITRAAELDSVYEVHAYDTLLAPLEGAAVAMQSRSLFLEPDSGGAWRVTDLFELRNDRQRTIVARPGGRTWSYPLPAEARDVMAGDGEMSLDAASFEDGAVVVRAALPPGERLFVVRYRLDSPYVSVPTPGLTETLDVLVREPVPPLEVENLGAMDRIELEPGSTFRRYTGDDVSDASVRLVATEDAGPPPVRWAAVVLAMALTIAGLVALRGGGRARASTAPPKRSELLLAVARLDEEFEAGGDVSAARRRGYERERAELMRRLRSGG